LIGASVHGPMRPLSLSQSAMANLTQIKLLRVFCVTMINEKNRERVGDERRITPPAEMPRQVAQQQQQPQPTKK
jgi:hypothetical protein